MRHASTGGTNSGPAELDVQNEVLYLKGKLIGVAIRAALPDQRGNSAAIKVSTSSGFTNNRVTASLVEGLKPWFGAKLRLGR